MSENDPNFSVFWEQGNTRTNPPSATALTTGKTVCEDTNSSRLDETIGLIVFEAGHGTIGGVEFEAALGADTVRGATDAPPYTYTFNTAFTSAPTVANVQMAGLDGNNGGWAQVHGATGATATSLFLSIDEDQIGDTERNHTTEQVAYAVFAGPVVYPPAPSCVLDSDCDDGLFCNGAETCDLLNGCQAGTPPVVDDGVACTDDSCDEVNDDVVNTPNNSLCDNGLFCDGTETCDPTLDCQVGTPPVVDDGVACTDDSCDEVNDDVVNTPNNSLCDNGLFCDGTEVCDPTLDCQASAPPVVDDGVACTDDSCDEVNDVVVNAPNNALCDNGLFCDGTEVCDPTLDCQAGAPPVVDDGVACTDDSCDEVNDDVVNAPNNSLCDNGLFCDGTETCNPALDCQAGAPPLVDDGVVCTDDSCDEVNDDVVNTPNNALCDNSLFCDGTETCDPALDCQAGTPPLLDDGVACTDDSCDEVNDVIVNAPNNALCDNGLFCDGTETCDPALDCQTGSDPCDPLGCDEVGDVCVAGPSASLESDGVTLGATPLTVNLTNSYFGPVVVATVQYLNNSTPVVTRVSNVTSTSFDVRLQNPSGGAVAAENVSYLVVEEGTWTIDGVAVEAQKYTSTVTDDNNSWVGEVQTYNQTYTNPVVLGQVMSENDPNFSVFWDQGTARDNPPSATALTSGKTVCEDTNSSRLDETIGFIVFEAGQGTIGGVEFESALGADTVLGVTNGAPNTYTFNTVFSSAPTVANVEMAGVDGGNGGWAQLHGATAATTTSLFLSIDEDQIGDTERNHTTEQVSYVVFAGPVVYPPAPSCVLDSDCDDGLFCNGVETCDAGSGICLSGAPVSCDDGVSCTVDSCNEATDSCDNTPNNSLCDNGLFCDGAEVCDPALDCQPGTPPLLDDGVGCTDDSCDEVNVVVVNAPNNALCDNGLFCDGAEVCDPVLDCQVGDDPCSPLGCDEVGDVCVGGPSASLESDSVTVGATPVTVNLTNVYLSPVVVATVQYLNNTTPVVSRVSNVTSTSFDLRLQRPSGGAVAAENVSYLVVEEGTWTIDGVAVEAQKYTSTVTDDAPSNWVGQVQTYNQAYTNPVVLGQVMSENDLNFSVFWDQGTSRTDPPSATALTTGKTVCKDTNSSRLDETIGFIVFEAGHGTIGGVEFEAALGADTVRGVTDSPPYTFDTAFASAPTVAHAQMAGVDGNNGGWAQTHGATGATTTSLFLSIDEDQIGDTERDHTTEQVAYVVFAGPVVYP